MHFLLKPNALSTQSTNLWHHNVSGRFFFKELRVLLHSSEHLTKCRKARVKNHKQCLECGCLNQSIRNTNMVFWIKSPLYFDIDFVFHCQFLLSAGIFSKLFFFLTFKWPRMSHVVKELPYIQQVFSGGIQENPLFPMARQPDRLQSRLLILCNLENHAKFQVCHC